ncbi:MAG: class I SAM-dependent methyltransferase [Thermoleophilaceae bacterium]|nr:class I SAM-dependent methyltransferase [Thermoleophilaceae bacterium]
MPGAHLAKVDAACVQCGAADGESLWTGREHEYDDTTQEPFSFIRCFGCGLVRLNPRPDVSELGRIYPPGYYAYTLLSDEPGAGLKLTDRLKRRVYQARLVALVDRLGARGSIRVLDVGCADGRLLDWYKASSVGDRLETHGVEMGEAAAASARRRGHRVVTGRFEVERELEPGSFDLIFASHVIEHVDDPKQFARHAADLLAPGGLLMVATPNWDSVDARLLKQQWGGNHFPRHWFLFDAGTLRRLAESVGLEIERVEYEPNPIFWVWSCHSWLKSRRPGWSWPDRAFPPVGIFTPSFQSFVLQSAFTCLDFALRLATGKTASMAVALRKPDH